MPRSVGWVGMGLSPSGGGNGAGEGVVVSLQRPDRRVQPGNEGWDEREQPGEV